MLYPYLLSCDIYYNIDLKYSNLPGLARQMKEVKKLNQLIMNLDQISKNRLSAVNAEYIYTFEKEYHKVEVNENGVRLIIDEIFYTTNYS